MKIYYFTSSTQTWFYRAGSKCLLIIDSENDQIRYIESEFVWTDNDVHKVCLDLDIVLIYALIDSLSNGYILL